MMFAAPSILDAMAGTGIRLWPERERCMRFQPPRGFPDIDEVTVSVALLVTTLLLFVTMILWVH